MAACSKIAWRSCFAARHCIIGANESSEASAAPEASTPSSPPSMVKWSVGDSVDYEVCTLRQKCLEGGAMKMRRCVCTMAWKSHAVDAPQVNGTWYPGYIARSDSKKLYFKYEASKFKSYEEPIDKADRDDLARLRAGSGSGPPASAKKKKPAARKPASKAKSPAKKKTVAKPAARKPAAKPVARKPAAKKPAAKKSCEPAPTAAPSPRRHAKPRRRPAKKKPAVKKSPAKKKSPARKKKK